MTHNEWWAAMADEQRRRDPEGVSPLEARIEQLRKEAREQERRLTERFKALLAQIRALGSR